MKIGLCLALGGAVAGQVLADAQTWMEKPASAVWNATDLNWDDGAAWAGDSAVFGASSEKRITVAGDVAVSNLTFSSDGYVIGGDGTLQLVSSEPVRWRVDENCKASVGVAVTNVPSVGFDTTLVKEGGGELELTGGPMRVLRFHGNDGTLRLKDCDLTVAYLRASYATSPCALELDGATLRAIASSSRILIGDTQRFKRAELGAGGLKIFVPEGSQTYSSAQDFTTADGVEVDGGITINTAGVFLLLGNSTFNGGVTLEAGQLRVTRPEALGRGPLRIKPGSTFFVTGGEVAPDCKVTVGDGAYVGSTGGAHESIILRNIGVSAGDNAAGKVGIGRQSGYSRAELSLTAPDSDAVGTFILRGDLDLTINGGVVTARADSPSPFFSTKYYASERPACATVGPGGFTFDTNGAETELGLALDFASALTTNVVEDSTCFKNPSFESGANGGNPTDWKVTSAVANETVGGRNTNTSGYTSDNAAYQTTNGEWYVVLRRVGTLSTTFTLPEAGEWRVVFDMGDRAGGYLSSNITVTVTVDDLEPFTIGPRPAGPFRRFDTPFWNLPAGAHDLVVATHDGSGRTHDSVLFDTFRMERIVSVTRPPFEKRGAGVLAHTGLSTQGDVTVTAGELRLAEPALEGSRVTVAAGAALRLFGAALTDVTAAVGADATLSFESLALTNHVTNGDFESPALEEGGMPASNPAGWTLHKDGNDAPGFQVNGSQMSTYNNGADIGPLAPSGVQTLYLRKESRAEQKLTVPADGTYRLSYQLAARQYSPSWKLPLDVSIDGDVVEAVPGRDAFYPFERHEVTVPLTAGEHTLMFRGGTCNGNFVTLFIDDVKLERTYDLPAVAGGTLEFAAGATLNLGFEGTLELDAVTVDGRPVRGNASALRAAGVNVTGAGKVQIGPPGGSVFIIR